MRKIIGFIGNMIGRSWEYTNHGKSSGIEWEYTNHGRYSEGFIGKFYAILALQERVPAHCDPTRSSWMIERMQR
jgi:hypothetical protein